jgi:RNA polymerase sigma-70 factor, ECF subfamily
MQIENDIVAGLRAGEEEAFESLLKAQSPALLRTARRFLRCEEDARDAVQDAFVSLFKSIASFESNSQLSTWLHRILINRCLMTLRKQRRHPEEAIESEPIAASIESAESIFHRAELRKFVRASVDTLPERHRTVVLLRDIEEFSNGEVARLLDVTPNAVKVRLHRAHQALRTLLDPAMLAR